MARYEKGCVDEVPGHGSVHLDRQKTCDAIKCQLKESEEALCEVQVRLAAATTESKKLQFRMKKIEEELLVARANVALKTSLHETSSEQLHTKVVELKKV